MKSATERLLAFSFANADILVEVDAGHRVRYVCGAVQSLLDRTEDRLRGVAFEELVLPADRVMVTALLRALPNNARLNPVMVRLAVAGEQPVSAMLGGYRMDSDTPRFYLTLAKARLTAVEAADPPKHDIDTGLLDRHSFTETLQAKLAAARDQQVETKLTLIRLEEFDAFKNRVGGDTLARMMEEVGGFLRAMSVDGSTAGRLAEDRFGIMHTPAVDPGTLEKSVADISRDADPAGKGVAVAGATVDLVDDELSDEDRRRVVLYTVRKFADSDGATTVGSLADGMKEILADTVKRVQQFKRTLADNRLRIALQPIVSLGDRHVHHYEALARPTDGQAPAGLVGFAEEIGMTPDFDLLVCQKAIDLLGLARESGTAVSVAVNLSAGSLHSQLFIKTFRAMIAQYSWAAGQLLIEVTESMRIKDLTLINSVLQTLRADGHKVCLDDFGAGAASFPYIQALDIDFVKIDGAYVRRLEMQPRDRAILKAMVGLCNDLGIGTVAEMVETETQAKTLADLGVGHAQGYLFGRPSVDFALPAGLAGPPVPPPENPARMQLRRRGAVETWGR
jgi:EAL domain-containing protein (putative c-di-GMP-specific phosphodiesterase class I)